MGNTNSRRRRHHEVEREARSVNITANALGPRSIKVTWDKVPNPNKPIKSYIISYRPGVTCSCPLIKIVDGNTLTTTLTRLNENTKYLIEAKASTHDSHGDDQQSGKNVEVTTLADFPGVDDGDVYQLWSYQSRSSDRYIRMTNASSGTGGYVVDANGIVDQSNSPTDITFVQQVGSREIYILQFQNNNITYSMRATTNSVIAATNINDPTHFEYISLLEPNDPYIVLKKSDEDLYLSSDGAGNMKLKELNDVHLPPPEASGDIDPALLFRLVATPK